MFAAWFCFKLSYWKFDRSFVDIYFLINLLVTLINLVINLLVTF